MTTPLATRCPACSTVFRVVPDQLRVSDGWVRCGRCAEVFNAGQALLDALTGEPRSLHDEATPLATAAAFTPASDPTPDRASAPPGDGRAVEAAAAAAVVDVEVDVDRDAGWEAGAASPFERTQVLDGPLLPGDAHDPTAIPDSDPDWAENPAHDAATAPGDDAPFDDPQLEPQADPLPDPFVAQRAEIDLDVDPLQSAGPVESDAIATSGDRTDPVLEPPTAATAPLAADFRATPSFVRRADRAERWRQPRMRAALAVVVVLSIVLLAAQVVFAYRDLVAARFASTRPLLTHLCAVFGCSLGPARAIEDLSVESSGLLRVSQTDGYRLNLSVRNRSGIALAMPAVDLSLTDSQGKLLARRVLQPAELGAVQAEIGAGRDVPLQATLQTATDPVAGYTIELFYP